MQRFSVTVNDQYCVVLNVNIALPHAAMTVGRLHGRTRRQELPRMACMYLVYITYIAGFLLHDCSGVGMHDGNV